MYHVNIAVSNADELIATDDVRIGGVRVGQVAAVTPEPSRKNHPTYAVIQLALDPSVGHLPVDSSAQIRAASALGATYVALTLGHSRETIPAGGTLPLARSSTTVAVTDLFQIFNANAARNFQNATAQLGGGLAGRGQAVNSTIGSVSALLPALTGVASALASPNARLPRFLNAYETAADALSPVSAGLAGLVSGGAVTFGALASQRSSLAGTIDAAPSTESAATIAFDSVRPGLDGLAQLMTALEPAAQSLPGALTTINSTLSAGMQPLRQLPTLTGPLRTALSTLETVSRVPSTSGALRELGTLMAALQQTLTALVPAQVHCNILGVFTQNFASTAGVLGTGKGPSMGDFGLAGDGLDTQVQSAKPAPDLHVDNLPTENGSECQSGNEPFRPGTQDLTPPVGPQPDHTRPTYPPPGVLALARSVGLLAPSSANR
jgi:virulence factor Mce-like protein